MSKFIVMLLGTDIVCVAMSVHLEAYAIAALGAGAAAVLMLSALIDAISRNTAAVLGEDVEPGAGE